MTQTLGDLRRPPLLVRAARHAQPDYDRARHLPRLLNRPPCGEVRRIVEALLAAEAALEDERASGAATYSVSRHIGCLAALMVEARLMGPDAARAA